MPLAHRRALRLPVLLGLTGLLAGGTAAVLPLAQTSALTSQYAISTGEMLGSAYNDRWFYISVDGGPWQPTYSGKDYKPAARGKLMNFRAANALFDDERRSDDPEGNTSRFVSLADEYAAHGVLAYTVSLQGGNPGYEGAIASAFRSDGSLKQSWLDRASRVIESANANGQVVILTYFYQRQDERLADSNAVRAGVRNATDWLIARNYRNVVIEIANEHTSSLYDRSVIINNSSSGGIAELINVAKSRFNGKNFRLPVSASIRTSEPADFAGALRDAADVVLVHGNLDSPSEDGANVSQLADSSSYTGPIVMNEDRQGSGVVEATAAGLAAERTTATNVFNAGGSWGLMWQPYNQTYPFQWAIGSGTDVSGGSKANYFHAVLDHMRSLVYATPHSTSTSPPSSTAAPSSAPAPEPSLSVSPTPTASVTPSPPAAGQAVESFTLISSDSDKPIAGFDPIPPDATIDRSSLGGQNLTLRANVTPMTVGSIVWALDANNAYRTEDAAPYSLGGDKLGDYAPADLTNGSHTVSAMPYVGAGATGASGAMATLTFTLQD